MLSLHHIELSIHITHSRLVRTKNAPSSQPVEVPRLPPFTIHSGAGFFQVQITGSSGNLPDGSNYAGWCASLQSYSADSGLTGYTVASTYLPSLNSAAWNEVNYILNNKQGTVQDVQQAIWIVLTGVANVYNPSTTAVNLAALAVSAGATFVPAPGQTMGVLLTTTQDPLQ